jgi:hypothetical protein
MGKIYYLDKILLILMITVTVMTGYMTSHRLIYKESYLTYDAWIFAMCFGLTLQIYDYHTIGKIMNTPLNIGRAIV